MPSLNGLRAALLIAAAVAALAAVIAMTIPRTDEPDESALSDWAAEEGWPATR